jgi:histidine ammonia-lyase
MSAEGGHPESVELKGDGLDLATLARIARDPRVTVTLAPAGLERVARAHRLVERVVGRYAAEVRAYRAGEGPRPVQDYGLTTGFGEFKDIPVDPEDLDRLQVNLLLSHAVGTGLSSAADERAGYHPFEVVRAVLVLRLNTFLLGCSGISPAMVEAVAAMLNRGIVPLVPVHGSVGSSGDLCPLAHTFQLLVGAGRYARVRQPADLAPGASPVLQEARHLAADLGLAPPRPSGKDALALINGATFSAAGLALAVHDAERLVEVADAAAALSVEAACGCARAFDPRVHAVRGMAGQQASAARMRALLAGSRLLESAGAVQDPYSLRCAPVVHGATRDALAYAAQVALREANAATDNPLLFPPEEGEEGLWSSPPWDLELRDNWPAGYQGDRRSTFSAGNFHGQPVALAADVLAIAVAELADIAERRIQLLLDRHHNRGLPANLVADRGVQSGLMIVQYGAAGLVSENKVLAHPASVDSIPTAANSEDHNSMASVAARKARTVVANVQAVLAMELLVAAQAIDWRAGFGCSPSVGPFALAEAERADERERFRAATGAEHRAAIVAQLGAGTGAVYQAVRRVSPPIVDDRPLAEDLRRVRELVESGSLGRRA